MIRLADHQGMPTYRALVFPSVSDEKTISLDEHEGKTLTLISILETTDYTRIPYIYTKASDIT